MSVSRDYQSKNTSSNSKSRSALQKCKPQHWLSNTKGITDKNGSYSVPWVIAYLLSEQYNKEKRDVFVVGICSKFIEELTAAEEPSSAHSSSSSSSLVESQDSVDTQDIHGTIHDDSLLDLDLDLD